MPYLHFNLHISIFFSNFARKIANQPQTTNENNPEQLEPDFDGISRIANEWVFIEH